MLKQSVVADSGSHLGRGFQSYPSQGNYQSHKNHCKGTSAKEPGFPAYLLRRKHKKTIDQENIDLKREVQHLRGLLVTAQIQLTTAQQQIETLTKAQQQQSTCYYNKPSNYYDKPDCYLKPDNHHHKPNNYHHKPDNYSSHQAMNVATELDDTAQQAPTDGYLHGSKNLTKVCPLEGDYDDTGEFRKKKWIKLTLCESRLCNEELTIVDLGKEREFLTEYTQMSQESRCTAAPFRCQTSIRLDGPNSLTAETQSFEAIFEKLRPNATNIYQ